MTIFVPALMGMPSQPQAPKTPLQLLAGGSHLEQGLNILAEDLVRTAPEYFNWDSPKGRAALVVAIYIATGEITDTLTRIPHSPHLLYTVRGGTGRRMLGWAQFDTKYWNPYSRDWRYRVTTDPVRYNRTVGRILYGHQPKPRGIGYFNLDQFASLLETGHFRTGEDIRKYLTQSFHLNDWQGLHELGGGAYRIRRSGIGPQIIALFHDTQPTVQPHYARLIRQKPPEHIANTPLIAPAPQQPRTPQEERLLAIRQFVSPTHRQSAPTPAPPRALAPRSLPDLVPPPNTQRLNLFQYVEATQQMIPRGTIEIADGKIIRIHSTLYGLTTERLLTEIHENSAQYYIRPLGQPHHPMMALNPLLHQKLVLSPVNTSIPTTTSDD